jgi:hypothetical protein
MEAPELESALKPVAPQPLRARVRPYQRPRVIRAAVVGLAIVLAWGLWQAYGVWLFSAAASHVF